MTMDWTPDWSPPDDWDAAYDNRSAVAGSADYPPRWSAAAAAFRARMGPTAQTLSYGAHERQQLDLFLPPNPSPNAPQRGLGLFLHGGYWMRFDRSLWSHLAAGALARGWAVAIPSYRLAPDARLTDIAEDVVAAIACAAAQVPGPLRLTGHSAGGHLATRMACAEGPLAPDLRRRLERVVSISGLHDLRPLMNTAMNATLRIDDKEAAAESPALQTPLQHVSVHAWVGALELPELRRQSALLAQRWTGRAGAVHLIIEADRHHLDVIEGLCAPSHPLTEAAFG